MRNCNARVYDALVRSSRLALHLICHVAIAIGVRCALLRGWHNVRLRLRVRWLRGLTLQIGSRKGRTLLRRHRCAPCDQEPSKDQQNVFHEVPPMHSDQPQRDADTQM